MSDQSFTLASLIHRCVKIYPDIVAEVYKNDIKDPKKLQAAIENDKWRFEEFPPKAKKAGKITKAELERLVQWKITHGVNRPFLPSMIRKNDSKQVSDQTAAAYKIISKLPEPLAREFSTQILPTTKKALDAACVLTGVGPATGTLILSIFDPDGTPFFQDELYRWLCSAEKKLKYDVKEYVELWEEVKELLLKANSGIPAVEEVRAVDVEKAAYVLEHVDVLSQEERAESLNDDDMIALRAVSRNKSGNKGQGESEEKKKSSQQSNTGKKPTAKSSIKDSKKRGGTEANTSQPVDDSETRRSKRKKT